MTFSTFTMEKNYMNFFGHRTKESDKSVHFPNALLGVPEPLQQRWGLGVGWGLLCRFRCWGVFGLQGGVLEALYLLVVRTLGLRQKLG